MIELKHIQQLEARVHSALELIGTLRTENHELTAKLEGYQRRILELEKLVDEFKQDQGAIEEGILRALKKLDALEDSVTETSDAPEPRVSEANVQTSQDVKASVDTDQAPQSSSPDSPKSADPEPAISPDAAKPEPDSGQDSDSESTDPEEEEEDGPDTGESELDIF